MAIYTIQLKRGKASSWADLNLVLAPGEPGFEIDTGKIKIGNGVDKWLDLEYVGEGKTQVINADTHYDFPVIGDVNVIYKASQEKQLYQWNASTFEYELIIDLSLYTTKEDLQQAIENIEIPEIALEDYATKAYAQELFNNFIPALDELHDAVDTIEADYLKAADKTELSNAISAADGKAVNAQNTADALSAKVGEVAEGKTVVEMIADAQSTANYDDTALANRVTTLEGNDAGKSVRTVANEELAKQLIAEGAQESLDTLAEIAAWIQAHPDDASAMNAVITALQTKVDTGNKTVSAYVTDAIALKADQAALEAEETARKNAVQANADAITAIKDHATVDSFADVMNEIGKKQNVIKALSANDIDAAIAAAV